MSAHIDDIIAAIEAEEGYQDYLADLYECRRIPGIAEAAYELTILEEDEDDLPF